MSENLWPEIPDQIAETSPIALLKEQASIISSKSQGLICGEVQSGGRHDARVPGENSLCLVFILRAPALNNYSVELFSMYYSLTSIYPVYLADFPLEDKPVYFAQSNTPLKICNDEQELKLLLKQVFGSPYVRQLIRTIITHSRSLG